jgi:hypothetical protein
MLTSPRVSLGPVGFVDDDKMSLLQKLFLTAKKAKNAKETQKCFRNDKFSHRLSCPEGHRDDKKRFSILLFLPGTARQGRCSDLRVLRGAMTFLQ